MANEHGTEHSFKVCKFIGTSNFGDFERVYGLIPVGHSFDEKADAEYWIRNEGDRQLDYTIIEVFRNK